MTSIIGVNFEVTEEPEEIKLFYNGVLTAYDSHRKMANQFGTHAILSSLTYLQESQEEISAVMSKDDGHYRLLSLDIYKTEEHDENPENEEFIKIKGKIQSFRYTHFESIQRDPRITDEPGAKLIHIEEHQQDSS